MQILSLMAIPDVLGWEHGADYCKADLQKLCHTFGGLYDTAFYWERHCYCSEKHYILWNIKYTVIQLKYKNTIKHEEFYDKILLFIEYT